MSQKRLHPLFVPGQTSFFEALCVGRFRWDLIRQFPEQPPGDREAGDAIVREIGELLRTHLDPDELDASRQLPAGFVGELQRRGCFKLLVHRELGGLGLSCYNTFRAIEAAATWSVPVASMMAVQTAIGIGAYLPAIPPGPLRDLIRARLAAGDISGGADTEPMGAVNRKRWTTATPVEDGRAWLITGEKVHIGNAPIANILAVSATVRARDVETTRLFFIDTDSPGFRVKSVHEFMGLKGFPNANLTFDHVRVPTERMLVEDHMERLTPSLTLALVRGRMYLIAAPSLAMARLGLKWMRQYANRRRIDDNPIGNFEAVQTIIAASVADVFALDSLAEWCMLCDGTVPGLGVLLEQVAAKNISSVLCWRVLERAMSLLASEGYEAAPSKARRGAPPLPLERFYRDARGLRISGGVDFQLDYGFTRLFILPYYYPPADDMAAIESDDIDTTALHDPTLSARNREHLIFAARCSRRFARTCLELARSHPDPEVLTRKQRLLIGLARVANELLTMSLVLARASSLTARVPDVQRIADVYCTAAAGRVDEGLRRIAARDAEPAYESVSRQWLQERELDFLIRDIVDGPIGRCAGDRT